MPNIYKKAVIVLTWNVMFLHIKSSKHKLYDVSSALRPLIMHMPPDRGPKRPQTTQFFVAIYDETLHIWWFWVFLQKIQNQKIIS